MKRKPGRPKKDPTTESATPDLAQYRVSWRAGNGGAESDWIQAHGFEIAKNGDLILTRDGATIAAFREWQSVLKCEAPSSAPPKIANDIYTLSYPDPNPVVHLA
jgi:hypothetical protein